ncbi:VPLPA-CTERM sorting domain-containing protein [Rhodovulum strictum]|nr:VPLPA-CTERM sorting domain-containing protein [Rhodovulum strictum]
MSDFSVRAGLAALALAVLPSLGSAATVIVNADEWATTDTGFAQAGAANVDRFVANLVSEFGTKIHAYSTNFAYTGASLAASMAAAGATYTTGLGITFDLPTLSTFDAILLGGNYLDGTQLATLSSYVTGGGNVYISAGTGVGGAAAEAAAWNPFLSAYNLQLVGNYVGPTGNVAMSGDTIFDGVSQLYFNNANGMTVTGNVVCCADQALFGVSRTDISAVPLPASGLLLGAALAGAGLAARRRRDR